MPRATGNFRLIRHTQGESQDHVRRTIGNDRIAIEPSPARPIQAGDRDLPRTLSRAQQNHQGRFFQTSSSRPA